jgi:simple sugar transport system ATP-binding protein
MSDVNNRTPIIEVTDIIKHYGSVIALNGVSMQVSAGEVLCLLGDNGAGKSTLIKTLSGVVRPSGGSFLVEGKPVNFRSPRDALDAGIATVYQDLAMIPLMSITRNFFMGKASSLSGTSTSRIATMSRGKRCARSASISAIPIRR